MTRDNAIALVRALTIHARIIRNTDPIASVEYGGATEETARARDKIQRAHNDLATALMLAFPQATDE